MTTSEITAPVTAKPEYARLRLGTAPDSWGIWFPDDPKQPHWSTFLDEVVESGFRTIELGPFGYLPTHPEQLKDELGKRCVAVPTVPPVRLSPRAPQCAHSRHRTSGPRPVQAA